MLFYKIRTSGWRNSLKDKSFWHRIIFSFLSHSGLVLFSLWINYKRKKLRYLIESHEIRLSCSRDLYPHRRTQTKEIHHGVISQQPSCSSCKVKWVSETQDTELFYGEFWEQIRNSDSDWKFLFFLDQAEIKMLSSSAFFSPCFLL
jgi:hypothetical protein